VDDLCDENSFKKNLCMKKLTLIMMIAFTVLSIMPAQLSATNVSDVKPDAPTLGTAPDLAITTAQIARLEEIKAMDMSTLSRSEKKVLRNEVKEIKSDQDERRRRRNLNEGYGNDNYGRHGGGGVVFVTAGGGLLVILLIILLL
jgi:hypothetical protein